MRRLDLTGLAYLIALAIAAFLGYKIYKGGAAAASAAADAIHSAVQAIGAPIVQAKDALTTAVLDKVITEPPNVANINSPVIAPPPRASWIGSEFFPSGQFVGDLEDVSGFYSSTYALHRDRVGANDNNAPGS